jgi:hypothetical protein
VWSFVFVQAKSHAYEFRPISERLEVWVIVQVAILYYISTLDNVAVPASIESAALWIR